MNGFDRLVRSGQFFAKIIRDFSGDWYSRTEYEEGIDKRNVSRFIAIALKKIRAELMTQKETV